MSEIEAKRKQFKDSNNNNLPYKDIIEERTRVVTGSAIQQLDNIHDNRDSIEAKRKELEEEAKSDLEMGAYNKAWKIEYIASKNMLDGFNLGVEMARKEILEKIGGLIKSYSVENKNCHKKTKKFYGQFVDELIFIKQSLEEKK